MDVAGDDAPFHAGERALQARAGLAERLDQVGRTIIRDHMPDQHRELFEKLPLMLVGSLDAAGQPWASVLVGPPGFVHTPDARTLRLAARPAPADPLADHLAVGAPLGLLGIELPTRRRNRVNGSVSDCDDGGFTVAVRQSFGNCPKYIQVREPAWAQGPEALQQPRPVAEEGARLSPAALAQIARADTFFIASAAPRAGQGGAARADGVDVSHRGGPPGFVRVEESGGASVLTVPDFLGNFLFNTLGNLLLRPAAGLLFIDFDHGDLLWLAGDAQIVHDGPEVAAYPGAQRLLRIRIRQGHRVAGALPLRWSAPEPSPHLAGLGPWPASS